MRNKKSFFAGMIVCALLFTMVIPTLAATLVNKELYYNNIELRLNGKTLAPKDANGKAVEPFVIDGTTYLPVRAIAEAMGLNVSWDPATQTVVLGDDPVMGQPAVWLGEMDTFTGSAYEAKIQMDGQYDEYFTANNGETFDRYYYPSESSGTTYLLKGQYSKFTGTLYLPEYYKTVGRPSRFLVYLDDRLVYTSPEVGPGIEPIPFSVNLNAAYKMEIVTQRLDGDGTWGNASYSGYSNYNYNGQIANAALWK